MRRLAMLLPLLAAVACRSLPPGVPSSYTAAEVPAALARVDTELAGGEFEKALARSRIAGETRGLSPEERNAVQQRLEAAALARIQQLSAEGKRPGELERIFDLELPRQLSASAGIEAARVYYRDKRKRMKAYRMVREVDSKYPQHQERARGAALLYDIGTDLAEDDGHYFFFFSYRALAPEVYEYLVLNHPEEPRGDIVYRRLADIYQRQGNWRLAIERNEDLILWHPRSTLVPGARARIPRLRLELLKSPEYDRTELEKARAELEAWLEQYPDQAEDDPELYRQVQVDLVDCLQRLADSDLAIARFYLTVGNAFGAELHARRAVEEASLGGDEGQVAEAEELLVRIEALPEDAGRTGGLGEAEDLGTVDELQETHRLRLGEERQ